MLSLNLAFLLRSSYTLVVVYLENSLYNPTTLLNQVMYMYYLLGYKILANSETSQNASLDEPNLETLESVSGVQKPSASTGRAKLTSSELRRRRTQAHFTRSVIFNYVSEEVQNQVWSFLLISLKTKIFRKRFKTTRRCC